jgi:hypothetical protein
VTRATLSNLSDLSAIGGRKNIARTKLLATGFTAPTRDGDGSASGPLARALDLLAVE